MRKILLPILAALAFLGTPTIAAAQPDPSLNKFLRKNRGRARGPIRFMPYAAGNEPAVAGGGWLIFDDTNNVMSFWDGTAWQDVAVGGGAVGFDTITTGQNLIATMTCGTGCAIGPAGTGTVAATTLTSTELNTIDLGVDAVGLTIEASGAQTAHLQDWDLSGGTTAAYVLSQGSGHWPQVNAGDAHEFAATIGGVTIPAYLSVSDDTTTPQLDVLIQRHTGAVAATAPILQFLKSRGTAAASTVVVTGDRIGQISAGGHDGTDYVESAAILFEAVGTIGNDRVPTQQRFFTGTDAAPTVSTLAMTIDEAQVVTFANPLGATSGGMGADMTALAIGAIPYADSTTTYSTIVAGAAGEVMTGNGAGVAPSFQAAAGGGAFTSAAGATTLNTATDFVGIGAAPGTVKLLVSEDAAAAGTPNILTLTGASHTGLTATTEVIGVYYDLSATKTWATGAITLQREMYVQPPTYAAAAASVITDAFTMDIGRPVAGANVTLTRTHALRVAGISSPGAGAGSEAFGLGAGATGLDSLVVGVGSDISSGAADRGIIVGNGTELSSGSDDVIIIGHNFVNPAGIASRGIFIGNAIRNVGAGGDTDNIFIGHDIFPGVPTNQSIFIGGVIDGGADFVVAIGYGTQVSADGVTIGHAAHALGAPDSIVIGARADGNFAQDSVLIGADTSTSNDGDRSVGIGDGVILNFADSVVLGVLSVNTAANQFVVGSASSPITTAYIGEGVTSASPGALLLAATGGSGSNIAAGTFTIAGGTSTGSGAGGDLVFQVHDGADAAAATPNVLTTVMTMVAGVVRYPKIETQIVFGEVTEPADVGSYGQIYTTTSNDLRFKGGDGVDNQVTLHNGAKYYFAAVGTALDLTEANIDHGIDAATTEHMDGTWAFKAGTNGATGGFTITDVANNGGAIRCTTSAAHGITAPSVVVITNTSDGVDLPNGIYYVDNVSDGTHFDLLGSAFTNTTATADYVEPSQLTAGADDAGQYDIEWDLNQEASGAGSTYITKSWKCTSAGVCAAYASGTRERTTTTTTIGHYYGKSIESAVASGDKYFLTVQAGATNVDPTNKYGSLSTRRH